MLVHNNNGNVPGAMFFAAYVGSSMNPTLHEPDIMEVMPYENRPLRVGDVAFFLPPESNQPVVHRIIRVTAAGISTLGDNNTREDPVLLLPKNIKGYVVAAWRGQKRRKIAGGHQGRLIHRWLRWRRVCFRGAAPLLHPAYQALARRGLIARALPPRFQPRVVAFRVQGQDQLQLLLGKRIIGRYNEQNGQWQIQRPFHLLVNGRILSGQQDRRRVNRHVLTERQRILGPLLARNVCQNLVLADGSRWGIAAGDKAAAAIVSQLGCAMRLRMAPGAITSSARGTLRRLLVQVDANSSSGNAYVPLASKHDGVVVCVLSPNDYWGGPYINLVRLSLVFARDAQTRGGVLIHGALAERGGIGVILAAPSGTGKSTASQRLSAPWCSLCDDTTLVVRDLQGNYWAHPWPTWSRFQDAGAGGTWDVQSAVPLKGIFLLDQAAEDRAERIGPGQAVSLLVECARQASVFMLLGLFKEEVNTLHLEQFNNLCALAQAVPAHVLNISLTGSFWHEIEKAIGEHMRDAKVD